MQGTWQKSQRERYIWIIRKILAGWQKIIQQEDRSTLSKYDKFCSVNGTAAAAGLDGGQPWKIKQLHIMEQ